MSKSESSLARVPPIDPETTTASIEECIAYAHANDFSCGSVLSVVILLIISSPLRRSEPHRTQSCSTFRTVPFAFDLSRGLNRTGVQGLVPQGNVPARRWAAVSRFKYLAFDAPKLEPAIESRADGIEPDPIEDLQSGPNSTLALGCGRCKLSGARLVHAGLGFKFGDYKLPNVGWFKQALPRVQASTENPGVLVAARGFPL